MLNDRKQWPRVMQTFRIGQLHDNNASTMSRLIEPDTRCINLLFGQKHKFQRYSKKNLNISIKLLYALFVLGGLNIEFMVHLAMFTAFCLDFLFLWVRVVYAVQ